MHIQGQIVRLKCENLLTYHQMEIFPCEKLNLIIGANGTGKSTIISAIILGLGGKASVVGRSKDLKQYVKLGQQRAKIEIELQYRNNNITITRQFDIHGASNFFINGKLTPQEKVNKLMNLLNIQIDNLCQILPQEKLEEFAKMNDYERLIGTLKTVGDPQLYLWFEELVSGKDTEAEIVRKLTGYQNLLVEVTNTRDGMEPVIKALKEKMFLIDCLKLLKQRKAWQCYFHCKQTLNLIDDKMKTQQVAYKRIIDVLKSLTTDIDASSTNIAYVKKRSENCNSKVLDLVKSVKEKQNEITTTVEKINDVKTSFKQVEKKYGNQEHDIKELERNVRSIKAKIDNTVNVDAQYASYQAQLRQIEQKVRTIALDAASEKEELDSKSNELRDVNFKLNKMNDIRESKMKFLEHRYEDCLKGLKWIDNNRHLFKGEVYGPMFLYLNVNDGRNAKYVEMCVPRRDLLAFFCERRDDCETLIKELREKQRLRISVVSALSNYNSSRSKPEDPIEKYKHLGFYAYVCDFINGPPLIVHYLTVTYQLHSIPVGNDITYNNTQHVKNFNVYFTDKLFFRCRKVPLTGQKIESSRAIGKANLLSANVDVEKMEELKVAKSQLEMMVKSLRDKMRTLEEQVHNGDKEIKQLRNDLQELQEEKNNEKRTRELYARKLGEYNRAKNNVIDIEAERKKRNLEVNMTMAKASNLFLDQAELFKELFENYSCFQKFKLQIDHVESIHQQNLVAAARLVKSLKDELISLKKLHTKRRRIQICCKYAYDWAMKATNKIDPRGPRYNRKNVFFKLSENVALLDKLSGRFQAKINCLGSDNDGLEIFREYKKTTRTISQLENKKKKYENMLENHFLDLDDKKDKWLTGVRQLINTIDTNFRNFFEMMECSGSVCLHQGDEDGCDDFKKYGIHIKVKFRENADLRVLDAQVQSGGERAVSIAIYLLSLQELTYVPFRCIDEINQGMDADNERRIFNLISKANEERGNTQYFLLTPKLLPNLSFTKSCKVFIPYNGIGSMTHQKYAEHMEKTIQSITNGEQQ